MSSSRLEMLVDRIFVPQKQACGAICAHIASELLIL